MEKSRLLRKAKLAVENKRIVKIEVENSFLSVYIFLTNDIRRHRDHIMTENSCDCKYFIFNKIYLNKCFCYHVLALKYSLESEKNIITIKTDFSTFNQILLEIYNYGKSLKLRKLIYT
ncbi:hypothetical protein [Acidianus manzaensis]|uniref:SWIM-type domain-containing protein n=1 Tax=Acidianus manzaensis TaxID=282676 RepID=A0A1W6K064_9CREN|nr:hypothetical protein [Acidianus manzaensis]ARM75875.1 hypothetical protein B6F84_07400 [Acidianus manzaensis]